jgi:hypothetical protein
MTARPRCRPASTSKGATVSAGFDAQGNHNRTSRAAVAQRQKRGEITVLDWAAKQPGYQVQESWRPSSASPGQDRPVSAGPTPGKKARPGPRVRER